MFEHLDGTWVATVPRNGRIAAWHIRAAMSGSSLAPATRTCRTTRKSVTIGDDDGGPCEVAVVGVAGNLPVEIWATVRLLECVPTARDETAVPRVFIRHSATVDRFVGCAELEGLFGRLFSERSVASRTAGADQRRSPR